MRNQNSATPRSTSWWACLLLAAAVLSPALPAPARAASTPPATPPADGEATADSAAQALAQKAAPAAYHRHIEREGVAIDLDIDSLAGVPDFRQGDPVRVTFKITDTNTHSPLSSLFPAAWMDLLPTDPSADQDSCKTKVEGFIGSSILSEPELDMNIFYVLTLNDDATISVVDPLFGFGNSKLLAMAFLDKPGYDWALTKDQRYLFVSMPEAGKVAVVTTADWKVLTNLKVGPNPGRLALQPDGTYLWVSYRDPFPGSELSGVTAIDVAHLKVVDHVETGRGDHDLAFDDHHPYVFVTNRDDGTVSVIDTTTLERLRQIETAPDPVSVSDSPVGGAVWVAHGKSGVLTAIDSDSLEVVARIQSDPGFDQIRFVPNSRLAIAVNPDTDKIYVIDGADRRIIQRGKVEDQPDQVAFSDELAYIRHRGSDTVLMVPLDEIGHEGKPIPVVDFPGGQHPPGEMSRPTPALGIVQAPGATAILMSNPGDKSIYYYKEGMAAPMGDFKNYGHEPLAVTVVDRSLQEVQPGIYQTEVKLRRPGKYDVAFFLDAPRLTHCFDFNVKDNPDFVPEGGTAAVHKLAVVYKMDDVHVDVGKPATVRFQLEDPTSDSPRAGLGDVEVLTFLAPGIWQKRHLAHEVSPGLYEVRFTPPKKGVYYVFVESRSQGFGYQNSPYITLVAGDIGLGKDTVTRDAAEKASTVQHAEKEQHEKSDGKEK